MEEKRTAEIENSAAEAERMLDAFASVGAEVVDVTLKNVAGSVVWYKGGVSIEQMKAKLPGALEYAERENVSLIVRPRGGAPLVQLDDITAATAARVGGVALCVTETSPGNFQAFVAVTGLHSESGRAQVRRRLIAAAGADAGATGAARLAGSLNVKEKHRGADGTYWRVRLVAIHPARTVTFGELERAGLLGPVVRQPRRGQMKPRRALNGAPRRAPSYEKAAASVALKTDGKPDRSKADVLYAVTCLSWGFTPEETVALLEENSPKARERKGKYAEMTVEWAARHYRLRQEAT